jgi:hypothetical protein
MHDALLILITIHNLRHEPGTTFTSPVNEQVSFLSCVRVPRIEIDHESGVGGKIDDILGTGHLS